MGRVVPPPHLGEARQGGEGANGGSWVSVDGNMDTANNRVTKTDVIEKGTDG